jgi:hypothetical protein
MPHGFLGALLRIRILAFIWITVFGQRARRVDWGVNDSADFEIGFVLLKELFPMIKTLQKFSCR